MHEFLSILGTIALRAIASSLITGIAFAILRFFTQNIKLLLIISVIVWLILIGIIPISFVSHFK